MRVLGIDYSLNCPALCLVDTESPGILRWYVNYRKPGNAYPPIPEVEWVHSQVSGDIARFIELAEWVCSVVDCVKPDAIAMEDYAFGASGNITKLAENAGLCKVELYKRFPKIPFVLVGPTQMKKYATTKGNAKKELIWECFAKKFPQYDAWPKLCHPKAVSLGSPCADIADSYYIAEYVREKTRPRKT